jgi:hypothetical protein
MTGSWCEPRPSEPTATQPIAVGQLIASISDCRVVEIAEASLQIPSDSVAADAKYADAPKSGPAAVQSVELEQLMYHVADS